jgi:hypothetical protein
MDLHTPVVDLSSVVAALMSTGGVSGLLSVVRILFLDRLLSRFDSDSQDILLRAAVIALNFAAVLLLSLAFGMPFGWPLLLSAVVAAGGIATPGSLLIHAGITKVQARKPQDTPAGNVYPVYPPDAEPDPEPVEAVAAPEAAPEAAPVEVSANS